MSKHTHDPVCHAAAIMVELEGAAFHIAHVDSVDAFAKLTTSFYQMFAKIVDYGISPELMLRTPVKILHGPRAGEVGTIAGDMASRDILIRAGLRRAIVCINDEFIICEISNLRELTVHEQILLGLK